MATLNNISENPPANYYAHKFPLPIIHQTEVAFPNATRPLPPSHSSSTIRMKRTKHHNHRSLQHLRHRGTFMYSSPSCRSVSKLRTETFTEVPEQVEQHLKGALSSSSARLSTTSEEHFNILYAKPGRSSLSHREHFIEPPRFLISRERNGIPKLINRHHDSLLFGNKIRAIRWNEQNGSATLHLPQPVQRDSKKAAQDKMDAILREQVSKFGADEEQQQQQAIGVRSYLHYLDTQQVRLGVVGNSDHFTTVPTATAAVVDKKNKSKIAIDSLDSLRSHMKVIEARRSRSAQARRSIGSETSKASRASTADENIIPRNLLSVRAQTVGVGQTTYRTRLVLPKCHEAVDVTKHHGFLVDLDIPALMKETGLTRQKIFKLWFQFKALCSMSSTPEGLDKHTFCSGIMASIVVEGPEVLDRQFDIHETHSGIIHFRGFVNSIIALSKFRNS